MSLASLFTVSQAAATLGVSTSLVRRICRRKALGAEVTKRLRLLTAEEVAAVKSSLGGLVGNPEFRARKGKTTKKSRKKSSSKPLKK